MAILRARVTWRRRRPSRPPTLALDLTDAERRNVRAALRVLYHRFGTWPALAKAMGIARKRMEDVMYRRLPSLAVAFKASRVAGVPLDDLLAGGLDGTRRKPGACPVCMQDWPVRSKRRDT